MWVLTLRNEMYITTRNPELQDLDIAFGLISHRLGIKKNDQKDVIALWRAVKQQSTLLAPVAEDRDLPPDERLIGYGISWFVSHEIIQNLRTKASPYFFLEILDLWRRGKPVFLTRDQSFSVEAGEGVDIYVFGWGIHPRYTLQQRIKIKESMTAHYTQELMRHRIHFLVEECYGAEERDRFKSIGLEVCRDYKEFIGQPFLPKRDEETHPYLMEMDIRKAFEKMDRTATPVGQQALLGPSRFGFSALEQELLRAALEGGTDEEIARLFRITVIAVKKRWQGIYEKIEAIDAGLFEEAQPGDKEASPRQRQKRRRVVQFVQLHPDELWPNAKTPGAAQPK
jgi:hypothetical protein